MPVHKHYPWQKKKIVQIQNSGHGEKTCPTSRKPYDKCYCGNCRKYRAKHGSNDRG